ncbi:MAG: transglutaminase domain-containing protein [Thermoanaerobaculia bacterium]
MKRTIRSLAVSLAFFTLASPLLAARIRAFDAVYTATLSGIPAGTKNVRIWIPVPSSRDHQIVSNIRIDAPFAWKENVEPEFGNHYLFATLPEAPGGDVTVTISFTVQRNEITFASLQAGKISDRELERDLKPDRLVTLSPRVRQLADRVAGGASSTLDQAHRIYDYLVTSMTYDKSTPGWGHGDSERACDIRKGNCTDFHSLFISLARARGIPARFVIGFPVSASPDGQMKGYHCWAEFWDGSKGWVPIDASEASQSKDPTVRAYLFGNLDPDRVAFSIGRDIRFPEGTKEPLNYFVYPYAESNGESVGRGSISLQYRESKPQQRSAATSAEGR